MLVLVRSELLQQFVHTLTAFSQNSGEFMARSSKADIPENEKFF